MLNVIILSVVVLRFIMMVAMATPIVQNFTFEGLKFFENLVMTAYTIKLLFLSFNLACIVWLICKDKLGRKHRKEWNALAFYNV